MLGTQKRFIIIILLLFFSGFSVFPEVVYIEETGFVLEPPVGWKVLDVSETKWTFQDFTGDAFLQIKIWPGNDYETGESLFNAVKSRIGAEGEGEAFDFYGRDAVFAVLRFNSGGFDYSGYGLFADGVDFDLTILAFASEERAALLNDYILSALDSFAVSPVLMNNPGPVSRYYRESYGAPNRKAVSTVIDGEQIDWVIDTYAVEASQLLIEREALILSDFKPGTEAGNEAWKRYYRMIYRDNYSRLDYPAALIDEKIAVGYMPEKLLSWVQGFEYKRTAGSDLISPLAAAAFEQGDCDSRALLYIILLNHYGIDSALMVSSVYSHAMAAVDVEGPGARINTGEKDFLVAETTDDVALGLIASDMADPANWLVIPLMEKEPWN